MEGRVEILHNGVWGEISVVVYAVSAKVSSVVIEV